MNDYRLRYNMPPPVILAKDLVNNMTLLGGLGVMGVGTMWQPTTDYHKETEAYKNAPIKDSKEPIND